MIAISCPFLMTVITLIWLLVRVCFCITRKRLWWKRELQLLPVYICIIVVVRYTFFPFSRVEGNVQPLLFDAARMFPLRINLIPFAYLIRVFNKTLKSVLLGHFSNGQRHSRKKRSQYISYRR